MDNIISLAKERFNSLPLPFKKDEHWRFSDLNFWGGKILEFIVPPEASGACPVLENESAKTFFESLMRGGKFDALCAMDFASAKLFCVGQNQRAKFENSDFANINIFEIGEGADVEIFDGRIFGSGRLAATANFYFVKSNARLRVNTFYNAQADSPRYSRADFVLQDGADVKDVFVQAGGSHTRTERNFEIIGENANAEAAALSVCAGNVVHDLRTRQIHAKPSSSSNLLAKNILSGASRAAFAGLIRVEEGAQKTKSYQSCRSLLLSENARASGMPVLEILANDVMCSHGCAVARPDMEQMFYMQSRGLGEAAAQRLIKSGFANEILEKFSDAEFAHAAETAVLK